MFLQLRKKSCFKPEVSFPMRPGPIPASSCDHYLLSPSSSFPILIRNSKNLQVFHTPTIEMVVDSRVLLNVPGSSFIACLQGPLKSPTFTSPLSPTCNSLDDQLLESAMSCVLRSLFRLLLCFSDSPLRKQCSLYFLEV